MRKAEADYGVVIVKKEIDPKATAKKRAEIRAARGWREVPAVQREDPLPKSQKSSLVTSYRVGVDVGGTFTDIVLLGSDGTIHTKKISSSVENYAQAIVEGLTEVFRETGAHRRSAIEEIRHGTTVASNAILEHKGARTGLITTKGFRDVLEIRTLRMPRMYDIGWTKPAPLVERYLRQVVDERIDAQGVVRKPLHRGDAERAVDALLAREGRGDRGVPAAFLRNPAHELLDSRRHQQKSAASSPAPSPARCCPRSRNTSAPPPRS